MSVYIHSCVKRLILRDSALSDKVAVNSECIWQQFPRRSNSVLQSVRYLVLPEIPGCFMLMLITLAFSPVHMCFFVILNKV